MKYIVIPLIKFILVIMMTIILIIVIVLIQLGEIIWNAKIKWYIAEDFWKMNNNPRISFLPDNPDLIYSNPFKWLFNGNFNNLN